MSQASYDTQGDVAVVNRAVVGFQVLPSARWSTFAQASKR